MNNEKHEIVRCRKCECALTDETEHILPNVNFDVCFMTCPNCGEVEMLNMEDYL